MARSIRATAVLKASSPGVGSVTIQPWRALSLTTTAGSTTVTGTGFLANEDVGKAVVASGIPSGATIASVGSTTSLTISAAAVTSVVPFASFSAATLGKGSLVFWTGDGNYYRALNNLSGYSGSPPTDTTNWQQITTPYPSQTWDSTGVYSSTAGGTVVTFGGAVYVCTSSVGPSASNPTVDATHWTAAASSRPSTGSIGTKPQAGSILLIGIGTTRSTSTPPVVSLAGWTQAGIEQQYATANNAWLDVFTKVSDGTETTITIAYTNTPTFLICEYDELVGGFGAAVDLSASASLGSGSSQSVGTATTPHATFFPASEAAFAVIFTGNGETWTSGSATQWSDTAGGASAVNLLPTSSLTPNYSGSGSTFARLGVFWADVSTKVGTQSNWKVTYGTTSNGAIFGLLLYDVTKLGLSVTIYSIQPQPSTLGLTVSFNPLAGPPSGNVVALQLTLPITIGFGTPPVTLSLAPSKLGLTVSFKVPTISSGSPATVHPSRLALTVGFASPTVTVGATAKPSKLGLTVSFPSPTVTTGTAPKPNTLALSVGFQTPTINRGTTASATRLGLTVSFVAPLITGAVGPASPGCCHVFAVPLGAVSVSAHPLGAVTTRTAPLGAVTVSAKPLAAVAVAAKPLGEVEVSARPAAAVAVSTVGC